MSARKPDVADLIMALFTTKGMTHAEALNVIALVAAYLFTEFPQERDRFNKLVDEQIELHKPAKRKA